MRKALVLVLLGLLVAAVPAFAEEAAVTKSFGASVSLETKSTVDQTYFETPDNDASFGFTPSYKLTVSASEGSLWSVQAHVMLDGTTASAFKVSAATSLLSVSVAKDRDKDYQLGGISDPFSFVTINDADALKGGHAVRLESSALGPSLKLQFDSADNVSAAAEYALDPLTVGGLARGIGKGVVLAGYAKAGLGIATVTGGIARDSTQTANNSAFGVQADVTPLEGTSASVSYVTEQANFDDGRTTVSLSGSTALAPLAVEAGYTRVTTTASGSPVSDELTAKVTYDVAPLKASAGVTYGNPEGYSRTNAWTKLEGSLEYGLIPDVATLKASFLNESDRDTDLSAFTESVKWNADGDQEALPSGDANADRFVFKAQTHTKFGGSVAYKLAEGLTVTPSFAYNTWGTLAWQYQVDDGDGDFSTLATSTPGTAASLSSIDLGVTVAYQLSSAASLSVGFSQTTYSFPAGISVTDSQAGTLTVPTSLVKRSGSVKLSLSF